MAINKVQYGNTTLIDLTSDTVTADKLMQGYTAHDRSGALITGTASGQSLVITDTVDEHGGTIRTITGKVVELKTKNITSNGTFSAEDDDADGYTSVTVNVSGDVPTIQSLSVTPSESQQIFNASSVDGYKPVTVGAISTTYVGTGITRRSSTDLTASGATVTVPSGYYSAQASKAVASGTAGTPTATKGTVSNHSVSVTPSVTNTSGYITGSTKTGTAVTVTASELVSGTYTVDSSGTKDVTNYASASVPSGTAGTPSASKGTVSNHSISVTPSVTNTTGWITGSTKTGTAVTVSASELVSGTLSLSDNGTVDCTNYKNVSVSIPFVTYYTGSSAPSSSLGADGDIYLKTV